ncbi:unnamed protein product [Alopecurus aequalis]
MDGTLLVFSLLLCILSHALPPPSPSPTRMIDSNMTRTDELALLSFKSMLSGGSLVSWNASGSYCGWPGVVCGGRQHPERVVELLLHSHQLSGHLSPSLGNLSFLRKLDLSDNQLVGEIPPELGRLFRLRVLNLSDNFLQGSIPAALGRCTSLTRLDLFRNELQGFLLKKVQFSNSQRALWDLRGTIGYAAPEYGAGNTVSASGDIYSYGILVLEAITGKRPTDSTFREGLSLREYVELVPYERTMEVVDPRLYLDLENGSSVDPSSSKTRIGSLVLLLRLGLSCSLELPSSRTPTGAIIKELHAIRESLDGLHNMKLEKTLI